VWIIWNERNMIMFQDKTHKSISSLGSKIITLAKHWCKLKGEGYIELLQLIMSTNVELLQVQITELNNKLTPLEEGALSGRGLDLLSSYLL
jgi:L-cystine uptake protein TcyP (sodium:dicarboxylate symporter family)